MMSWIPLLNNVGFVFAIIGLILGVIALISNRKNKKTISILATILSLIAMIIVVFTQSFYSHAIDETSKSISSENAKASKHFKWTKSDYDNLVVGDATTGVGGANYDDIVAKYGKPNTSSEAQSGNLTVKNVSWDKTTTDGKQENVSLTFIKQNDGSFLLSGKNANSLQ